MPRLRKLAEKYKNCADVQFVTLNLDENRWLIESAIQQLGLALTVIPAYGYVTDTFKVRGIPQNWIVDRDGTVRLKGYDDSTEKWLEGMTEAVERFRAGR